MKEYIVNLFLFIDTTCMPGAQVLRQIGASWHEREGTDAEKLAYLQSCVEADFPSSKRYLLPKWCVLVDLSGRAVKGLLTYPTFQKLREVGRQMEVLEDAVFQHCPHAPRQPLMCITPVVDGKVRVEGQIDL